MTSDNRLSLANHFDCVVMLTASDWNTEPRSNRYHYASRFANHIPVLFVQPDLKNARVAFERTTIPNVDILHISSEYGAIQNKLLNTAILQRGFIKPCLWIYNPYFSDFIAQHFTPLSIFHATEDYFSKDISLRKSFYDHLNKTLKNIDLLVAVSQEVLSSYQNIGNYTGDALLLPNGCDYNYWAPKEHEINNVVSRSDRKKIVIYQGGLNWRLDWPLIDDIGKLLPDWQFWLCGKLASESKKDFKSLVSPNIKNLGYRNSEDLRALCHEAMVGIIPFKQIDLIEVSLPLKAFEYVACGLPVVSVPIKALLPYSSCFEFGETPQEFADAIIRLAPTRHDVHNITTRLDIAAKQDYDVRFSELIEKISNILSDKRPNTKSLNVLVFYDPQSIHINTINEHLQSFSMFSRNHIFYVAATRGLRCTFDLSIFDVIVLHYCVRLSLDWHLSEFFAEALREFGGYKILFIQDEYDTTETARQWMISLGINAVFTCVPDKYIDSVYPRSRFPYLEFVPTLTGYVPLDQKNNDLVPIDERQIVVGYRGKPLPYYYGDLCREKTIIAEKMKDICNYHGISSDIEYTYEKRIYGDEWYAFTKKCKATLGTESGSNVFDDFGTIKNNVEQALQNDPSMTYEEIHEKFIGPEEGRIIMNQISPRIFEAISFKTALVLFEGTYSGVVEPNKHFIPLKKDFSNIDEVLLKLQDDCYLEQLTERAYRDVIESGNYSYNNFIKGFDHFLSTQVRSRNQNVLIEGMVGIYSRDEHLDVMDYHPKIKFGEKGTHISFISNTPLSPEQNNVPLEVMYDISLKRLLRDFIRFFKMKSREMLEPIPIIYRTTSKIYHLLLKIYYRIRLIKHS